MKPQGRDPGARLPLPTQSFRVGPGLVHGGYVTPSLQKIFGWLPRSVVLALLVSLPAWPTLAVEPPPPAYCGRCVLPDNGSGSADLPPLGCDYIIPNGTISIVNGLPPGSAIDVTPRLYGFHSISRTPGGNLGGEIETFNATLDLGMLGLSGLSGFSRLVSVPVGVEIHLAPRSPGAPVQTLAAELVSMSGVIIGDPDFCLLQVDVGASLVGIPSTGETTLTMLPDGSFSVDSFFDTAYIIDFEGCPGSILETYLSFTLGIARLQAGSAIDACDDVNSCTTDSCSALDYCLHVNNTDPCDDGLFCTIADTCIGGACKSTTARDCSDGLSCNVDFCDDSADLCRHVILQGPLACTQHETVKALNTNAATDSGTDTKVALATNTAGAWMALWQSRDSLSSGVGIGTDWDILFSSSTDDGATWSFPAVVDSGASSDSGGDARVRVASDGEGRWIAVWNSRNSLRTTVRNDFDIFYAVTTDRGLHWTVPTTLNSNAPGKLGADRLPDIASDGAATWMVAWQSLDPMAGTLGIDPDLLYSISTNGGATWSPAAPLNINAGVDTGIDSFVDIESGGGGTWMATWFSKSSLGGTIGTDTDILSAVSTDNGATWSPPRPVDSFAAAQASRDKFPRLATDGNGVWMTLWASKATLGGSIGRDFDILVSVSTDNGTSWSTAAPVNTTASGPAALDSFPYIVTDGLGTWMATWHSKDTLSGSIGIDKDVLYAFSYDRGTTWTAPMPLNSNAAVDSGDDKFVSTASDKAGTFISAWTSNDSLGQSIGSDFDILTAASHCQCLNTTTTSSTSTTTTAVSVTTSFTTTTWLSQAQPCGFSRAPACDGSCPLASHACVEAATGECHCQDFAPDQPPSCGALAPLPQCWGACPPGKSCVHDASLDTCTCTFNPVTVDLCGDAAVPQCDGGCLNPLETCMDTEAGYCACQVIPIPCGDFVGAPLCWGECPPLQACVEELGVGSCVCRKTGPAL